MSRLLASFVAATILSELRDGRRRQRMENQGRRKI